MAYLLTERITERTPFLLKISSWFCFLDARAGAFGGKSCGVIRALGGEEGLSSAVLASKNLLSREYGHLYPEFLKLRDQTLASIQEAHHRSVAIFANISDSLGLITSDKYECITTSLQRVAKQLQDIPKTTVLEQNLFLPFSTASSMYHAAEIYSSRAFQPDAPLYTANTHAVAIIQIAESIYRTLSLAYDDTPPNLVKYIQESEAEAGCRLNLSSISAEA
ncbi:hypothetical protein BU24DRAFT_413883 [Aaosphaeria arxii CBS 175.79]|uniref:Uncharacterized protein n=1 Tax=Aaosphaeria arxii CBS 175.79 TaxID=1450172 RepID=A0A6A5XBJ1_9PLEO|nr:uncharacterized protein BU24DRAFT_413883 [Aaosphaeria arxii CBS 175.79]KAF2010273.1 hypothetical protein BU24DRAFT_413883 [Aaosphaeria arxii CBS 175.79]